MNISDLNGDGIGLDGFDPVSYFDGEPLRGTNEYSYTLDGVTYRFANEENQVRFEEDPARYIPQYGGYCAVGVTQNQRHRSDPETYKIHEGRLYLFSRQSLDDARVSLEDNNFPDYVKQADSAWALGQQNPEFEMRNLHDSNN